MIGIDTGLSLMRASFGMFEASMKFSEMMLASHSVIGTRVDLMNAAVRDPFSADYAELGRMVPEKMAAFSQSGAALAKEWSKAQGDMFDQWREWGTLMSAMPTPGRIAEFNNRSAKRGARAVTRSMGAGGAALEPVHKAATANARRLKRSRSKRG
jgi:hypothetical protein